MSNFPNWLEALAIIAPTFTGLGGYWLAGRNEEARDIRATARETAARNTLLAERLDERKHSFQLDLLLELQEVLQLEMRATSKAILQDLKTLREDGKIFQLPPHYSDESYDIGVTFTRLTVRVLDQALRDKLEDFHDFISKIAASFVILKDLPPSEAINSLESTMRELANNYIVLNAALGELLRKELGREP